MLFIAGPNSEILIELCAFHLFYHGKNDQVALSLIHVSVSLLLIDVAEHILEQFWLRSTVRDLFHLLSTGKTCRLL